MKLPVLSLLLPLAAVTPVQEVTYRVALTAAQTQMVDIEVELPVTAVEESLQLHLPAWRPGRYEILDTVDGLRDIQATDGRGGKLPITKTAKATWVVEPGRADRVVVSYRIYANDVRDRTRHVDASHAFLSGSSVFLYSPRLRSAPVKVIVAAPQRWKIATGLETQPGHADVLVAANYDVLVDSPLEIGLHDVYTFEALGKPHEIVVWPPSVELDAERLKADFARIVAAQTKVFGRVPYERYVFLIHVGVGGGGTEHLNSTIMQTSRRALEASLENGEAYRGFLGLVSHELFHTWNVKQLRPAGIHPYDYQRENYTDLLWVAEGFTTYYGALTLVRAGLLKERKYLDGLGRSIHAQRTRPGTRVQSLSESSFDAWTKFNSRSADDVNSEISFYSKGALVGLLLDLELRGRTENRVSLDLVMRTMFERFPLSGPGYTKANLIEVAEELSASSFTEFFARYVDGTEELPLERALATAGLELYFEATQEETDDDGQDEAADAQASEASSDRPEPGRKAYLGVHLSPGGSGARVDAVRSDGPAYRAGLLAGDEIIALNHRRLRPGDLDARLKRLDPGDTVVLHLLRRDELHELTLELGGVADGKWKVKRLKEATQEQKGAFADWLGAEWGGAEDGEGD